MAEDDSAPCRVFGCDKQAFVNPYNGQVHESCSFQHARLWNEALLGGTPAEENGESGYMLPRCKFKGCCRPVFCERDLSFMHDYCGRTHSRKDWALEAP